MNNISFKYFRSQITSVRSKIESKNKKKKKNFFINCGNFLDLPKALHNSHINIKNTEWSPDSNQDTYTIYRYYTHTQNCIDRDN